MTARRCDGRVELRGMGDHRSSVKMARTSQRAKKIWGGTGVLQNSGQDCWPHNVSHYVGDSFAVAEVWRDVHVHKPVQALRNHVNRVSLFVQ